MAFAGSSLLAVLAIASFVAGQPPFGPPPGFGPPEGGPGNRQSRERPGAGGLPPFPGSFAPGNLPPFPGRFGGGGPPPRPGSNGGDEGPPQRPGSNGGGRGPPPRPGSNIEGEEPPQGPGSNGGEGPLQGSGSNGGEDRPQRPGSNGGGRGPPPRPGSNIEGEEPTQGPGSNGGEDLPQRPGSNGGEDRPQRPGSNGGGGGRPQRPGGIGGGGGRPQGPGGIGGGGGQPQGPGGIGGGEGQSSSFIPLDELVSKALAQASENTCSPGANSCNGNSCGKNLDPVFQIEEDGEWRILITNGLPNHTYGVGAEQDNPNEACVHNSYMKVPKNPTVGSFQSSGMGPVGIALSGAFFYNHLSTPNGDVAKEVEGASFDSCSGHADPQCRYHYHMVPKCLDPDNTCKLVGYMMDGIPVYSYCTIDGVRLRSCYKQVSGDGTNQSHYEYSPDDQCHLDEANGYDFGGSKGYGYVFSENYPFIMRGFMGSQVYSICSVQ
ncbi:collagen alpha-1(III) chain-like isoform X2 [Palaemon carinicauda]|uniref:collagen alpha-1(III) chain-like isoform X2 n=1 Tax=Palaemon carinicauda TaxID=392227 RepID=UPI0035B67EE4